MLKVEKDVCHTPCSPLHLEFPVFVPPFSVLTVQSSTHVLRTGDVVCDARNGRGSISELGFRFLLMDVSSQMWKLMAQYVNDAEETMRKTSCTFVECSKTIRRPIKY